MATSKQEGNETKMDEKSGADLREFLGDVAEEGLADYMMMSKGPVSMFCKSCLHPYTGEQKSNAIVLRCERCGQTDTILEEDAVNLKPEEWQGNLVLNRFVQVIKEQEELRINISDPFYADDDYQRYHLAVTEYVFNMKLIAEQVTNLIRVTKDAYRRQVIAKRNAKAQSSSKIYKDNEKGSIEKDVGRDENEEVSEKRLVNEKNEETLNAAKPERDCAGANRAEDEDESSDEEAVFEFPAAVKEQIKRIEPTFFELMKDLILKYNLPAEILDGVKLRMQDPILLQDSDDESEDETAEKQKEATVKVKPNESVVLPVVENTEGNEDTKESDLHEGKPGQGKTEHCTEETKKDDSKKDNDSEYMVFHINKKKFAQEFIGALRSKFDLQFHEGCKVEISSDLEDDPEDDTDDRDTLQFAGSDDQTNTHTSDEHSNDNTNLQKNETNSPLPKEMAIIQNVKGTDENEYHDKEPTAVKKIIELDAETKPCTASKDAENASMKLALEDTEPITSENDQSEHKTDIKPNGNPATEHNLDTDPENQDEEEDSSLANFHLLSSAFIRELQERKQHALSERKTKALAVVHEKVERLKKEVTSAELRAKEELTRAYENKKRKIENQRRQLDKKHEEIKEIETRMHFYARTGQRDKLAELLRQVNRDYDTDN